MEYRYNSQTPQSNAIIVKGSIGTAKPFTHDLPDSNHTYGKAQTRDKYNAGALTSQWVVSKPSKPKPADLDFKKLNKIGPTMGVVHAPTARQFALSNPELRIQPGSTSGMQTSRANLTTLRDMHQSGFVYGQPNRPSTPIKGIISHQLANYET